MPTDVTAEAGRTDDPGSYYRYYVLGLLFLVSLVNFMDRQVFSLLIESIKIDLDVSDTKIGLVAGLGFAVFHAVAGLPLAHLADTRSRKAVLALGMMAWSLCTVACGLAANFVQLAIARLGVGIGEATGTPTSHSLVSDFFPKDGRAMALGLVSVGSTAGLFIASLAGGWINQHYGWRLAFIIMGIPGVLLSILLYLTLKEPPRGRFESRIYDPPKNTLSSLKALLSISAYRHVAMAAATHGFFGFTLLFWNPAYLSRVHGMGSLEIGAMLALFGAPFGAIGMLLMGQPTDILARRDIKWYGWILAITTALVIPFIFLFLFYPTKDAVYFLGLIFFFSGAGVPALHAITQSIVPPNTRAMAAAVNVIVIALAGSGFGAAIVGYLNDALTPTFGQNAIQYSLTVNAIAALWCVFHSVMAAIRLPRND